MLNNLIDALQLVLLIFIVFTLNKERKINKYKEEEELVKQENKEIVQYIKYCPSYLSSVERFVNNVDPGKQYRWSTWEDRTKGTIIRLDYMMDGDDSIDLFPGNYLIYNQAHKSFSYLTPAELLAETDKNVKEYKQWVNIKEELVKQEDKEIVEYIEYCPSSLSLVERFANNFVDLSHYHWCTWEHSTKGTVISIDYQLGGDEWLDLHLGHYLVFNQTHKSFSYLTHEDLLVEINTGVKNYKQWIIT